MSSSLLTECARYLAEVNSGQPGSKQRPDLINLSAEMEKQKKQDLPNIFEDIAVNTFRNLPQLFNLETQLKIINKFWFRT